MTAGHIHRERLGDIDVTAGIYSRSSLKEVVPDLREIYFDSRRGGRQYVIKDYLKDGIRWEHHHLATDPPDTNFNIICLRNNVLTYYRNEARKKTLTGILESLLPGGLFIIGCHERLPFESTFLRQKTELSYVFQKY